MIQSRFFSVQFNTCWCHNDWRHWESRGRDHYGTITELLPPQSHGSPLVGGEGSQVNYVTLSVLLASQNQVLVSPHHVPNVGMRLQRYLIPVYQQHTFSIISINKDFLVEGLVGWFTCYRPPNDLKRYCTRRSENLYNMLRIQWANVLISYKSSLFCYLSFALFWYPDPVPT